MPREVELTPIKGGTTTKFAYTLTVDGTKKASYKMDPLNAKHQKQMARETGVDVGVLLGWFDQASAGAVATTKKFLIADAAGPRHRIYVRPLEAKRADGAWEDFADPADGLASLIDKHPSTTILEWDADALDHLTLLDIDFHDPAFAPSEEWLVTTVLTKLQPHPFVWKLSRSRKGVHAFYRPADGLTAYEMAALAGLMFKTIEPRATIELKRQVRGGQGADVRRIDDRPDATRAALAWLAAGALEADDEATQAWIEAEGLEMDRRYEHERCPFNPCPSHGEPVVVGEAGIFCHRCQATGHTLGAGKPGFAPWSVLVGGHDTTVLRSLVENMTHWGHAKWVIKAVTGLEGPVARACYSAALKAYHTGRPTSAKMPLVFHPDTDSLVRYDGVWGSLAEGFTFQKDMDPLIDILPAANLVTDEGVVKVNKSSAYILKQPVLKAEMLARGYPAIQVVRGFKMIRQYTDTRRLVVDFPAPWLQEQKTMYHPRYEPAHSRMPLDEAKNFLEAVLPGINWQYLYAILAARAANEARVGLPQHLLVTGVTGAAKTAHAFLAAGLLGDVASQVQFAADLEKFRSGLREASAFGSILVVDEFMKDSLRANTKLTQDKVLDPLLNLNPGSMSHKMYLGPVALGHLGLIIWTETTVPLSLRNQAQIARRVHYIKLVKELNWDQPLAKAGLSEIQMIRTLSVDHARACNAIVSDFVDRFLPYPRTFDDLASELGVQKLRESAEFEDPTDKLIELYKAVIAEPQSADALFLKKFPGKGYKRIDKDKGDDRLVDAWTVLANGGGSDWYQSQAALEKDWSRILGVSDSVHLDVQDDQTGHQLAIRFRVGQKRSPEKVNEEIKPLAAFK